MKQLSENSVVVTSPINGAVWFPAVSNLYMNLPFLPVASWNPGKKINIVSPSPIVKEVWCQERQLLGIIGRVV